MPNVFIIHGSNGYPEENWFPWLKREIEQMDIDCTVPAFPCGETHSLELWYREFENYLPKINEDTIFVAHSRGVSFVLNLLNDFEYHINSLYMVGGFTAYLWQDEKSENDSFFAKSFDFGKIKKRCKNFINIYSDNDPYIPIEHSQKLSEITNATELIIPNAGHFNTQSGYTSFPKLLELIKFRLNTNSD
jgi:uncharacterized protein